MNRLSLQQQAGMTLLEVLVATGILAIISVMAFVSIDNMVRAKTILNEHTRQLNQSNLAFYLLQNDLQFAVSSQQLNLQQAEFSGNSQSFSLIKFQDQIATSSRIEQAHSTTVHPLQRVRWFLRDNHLYRAVQAAHATQNLGQWQERKLLKVKSFNCNYKDLVGSDLNQWPNDQTQNSQLPKSIQCLIVSAAGLETNLLVTPWQSLW